MLDAAKMLKQHGYELYATVGTSKYLAENGIENTCVYMPQMKDNIHRHSTSYTRRK